MLVFMNNFIYLACFNKTNYDISNTSAFITFLISVLDYLIN